MTQGGDTEELVARARDGDLDAFEDLIRLHGSLVFRVALRLLGNRADAEDVTQDVLLQAWRSLDDLRDGHALRAWLYRVATNRCLNLLRSRQRSEPMPDEVPSSVPGPARTIEARTQLEEVARVILELSPPQRAVLVLREFEGCSHDEIADILGIGVPAVKSRLHRARGSLLTAMREWS